MRMRHLTLFDLYLNVQSEKFVHTLWYCFFFLKPTLWYCCLLILFCQLVNLILYGIELVFFVDNIVFIILEK